MPEIWGDGRDQVRHWLIFALFMVVAVALNSMTNGDLIQSMLVGMLFGFLSAVADQLVVWFYWKVRDRQNVDL